MKSLSILLASCLVLMSMTFSAPGDPIPGVDIKLGRKPPKSGSIAATGKTDDKGFVEFKNLESGTYFLQISHGGKNYEISAAKTGKDIEVKAADAKTKAQAVAFTQNFDAIEVTVTTNGNTLRGTINKSRSNIKR